MVDIAPSLLSADFADLKSELKSIEEAGCTVLHYDVMDGHFVPNISFGADILHDVHQITNMELDVHLMISDPMFYVDRFIKAGASYISFHIEAMESVEKTHELIKKIKEAGVKASIAINPGTSYEAVIPFLDEIDMILVMSVQPGFGGQKFNPVAIDKIAALSKYKKEKGFLIEVDGGINATTIQDVRKAGCDLFVAGSAVFNQNDRKKAVEALL
ncbi:ribulose-phosphate 3-epimerase [Sharpea azabuensis]|uniref:Ribulose-phosphate 3-epimerase n=1 Tax=Sharpea porci TaxID=2652286 RepID=A0A844FR25_9FIRM|nr:ribulose-phosphate 3-epimerase [Sharpea porci]MST88367.1 ribulose-phosphate 3-epimerase [Sharpea porci]